MKTFHDVRYAPCTGVYEPAEDTYLIAGILECTGDVLEIGTGSGVIGIYCAMRSAKVTATDIYARAIECARANAALNGVDITLIRSDLFSHVTGEFDEIIFNPPYLPSSDAVEGAEQWNGGEDGFSVTRPFLEEAGGYLRKSGKIRTILSDLTDIETLKSEFPEYVFTEEKRENFDFETIYAYTLRLKK